MTAGIAYMLKAENRELKLRIAKHQRTILDQMETIEALNRQIAALGRVVEKGATSSTSPKGKFHSCDIPGCAVCDPTHGL